MKLTIAFVTALAGALLTGCNQPADVASENLSVAADNFEVERRIVFYNGITGQYILSIEGLCSKGNNDTDKKVSFTCKVGPNAYKKHYLGVSDNVTWFMPTLVPNHDGLSHILAGFGNAIVPQVAAAFIESTMSTAS
jgi:hypothetical protein